MASTFRPTREKTAAEIRTGRFSVDHELDDGVLIDGVPTAVATPSGLTVEDVTVFTSEQTFLGRTTAPGRGFTARLSGGTAGVRYNVRFTFSTNTSPDPDTIEVDAKIKVVA